MLAADAVLQNRYRIVRLLNQGGMGAVYQANDERLDITVALKECFFDQEVLRKQFEREARLLAKLRHPAITKVIDHFTEGAGQFLVMEFIPGADLCEMLKTRGGPFPAGDVLWWTDQLLDALDYLHNQQPQIIHRDIKPQNLKLISTGQIILLDFGLAKSLAGQTSNLASSGSIFGYTQHYAPLEQIQGTGTDSRSDLYSLAATVYQLLTGVIPPDALTRATTVLNNQPDPLRPASEINGQVTPAVAAVLMQALALNRDQRPASARSMRSALQAAATARQTQAATVNQATEPTVLRAAPPPTAPRPSRKLLWVVAALVVIIGAAALALLLAKRSPRAAVARPDQTNPSSQSQPAQRPATGAAPLPQSLTGHRKEVRSVAFSPDGKTLASGSSDGTAKLWDASTRELLRTFEAPGSEVVAVAFSPDGESIAMAASDGDGNGFVFIRDSKTGAVKQKLATSNIQAIAFSPDSRTLAVANISSSLNLWDVATGSLKRTLEGQDIQTHAVVFSPDGKRLAGGGYGNTVKLWDVQTGALKQTLAGHDNEIIALAFSADGKRLASGSNDSTLKVWDAETGQLQQTLRGTDDAVASVAFSPDGKIIAGACNRAILLWEAATGKLITTLTGHEDVVESIAFSPDGKRLASGGADATVKLWDVPAL